MALLMTMENQSDRELLELAAVTVGAKFSTKYSHRPWGCFELFGKEWNPLTDDGDALRLAVNLKMGIEVGQFDGEVGCVCVDYDYDYERVIKSVDVTDGDYLSATRRCIVMVAAEVGRRMQDEQSTAARA
jgi:hypothetical protein